MIVNANRLNVTRCRSSCISGSGLWTLNSRPFVPVLSTITVSPALIPHRTRQCEVRGFDLSRIATFLTMP
jgi:hypothetical protein